jgi:hypothetical protein
VFVEVQYTAGKGDGLPRWGWRLINVDVAVQDRCWVCQFSTYMAVMYYMGGGLCGGDGCVWRLASATCYLIILA